MNTDADLEVGEFGIATRMVQPRARPGAPPSADAEAAPGRDDGLQAAEPADRRRRPRRSSGSSRRSSRSTSNGTQPRARQGGASSSAARASATSGSPTRTSPAATPRCARRAPPTGSSTSARRTGSTVNGRRQTAREARERRPDHRRLDRACLSPRSDDCRRSVDVEGVLLLLKACFLVLLYLFIWRIVRTASRDLRLPQESFVLGPREAAAVGLRPSPS